MKRFIEHLKTNPYFKKVATAYGVVFVILNVGVVLGLPWWLNVVFFVILFADIYFTSKKL